MINLSFILAIDDKFLWFNGLINHAGSMLVDHEKNSQLTSSNNFFTPDVEPYRKLLCENTSSIFKRYYFITLLHGSLQMCLPFSIRRYRITLLHEYVLRKVIGLLPYYAVTRFFFH